MPDDIKGSLERLHAKQDEQTQKLESLEKSVLKQELAVEFYTKNSERTAESLKDLNLNMMEYNAELKIHIAGVKELREQNNLIRTEIAQREKTIIDRLTIAEKPITWITHTLHSIKWLGVILSVITAVGGSIMYIVNYLSKLQ